MALALKHKARTEQLEAINAELLEALEAFWLEYEPQYVSAMADDQERTSMDDVADQARAAIKHAKGEAV